MRKIVYLLWVVIPICFIISCSEDENDITENNSGKKAIDISSYKNIFESNAPGLLPVDFQPGNKVGIKSVKNELINIIPEWKEYRTLTSGGINFIEVPLSGDVYNAGTWITQQKTAGSDDDYDMKIKTLRNKSFLIIREDTKNDSLSYYVVDMAMEDEDVSDLHFLGNDEIGDGLVFFSDLQGRCTASYKVKGGKRYAITISSEIQGGDNREFNSISLNHIPNLSQRLAKSYSYSENGGGGFGTSSDGWALCSVCKEKVSSEKDCGCEGVVINGNGGGSSYDGGWPPFGGGGGGSSSGGTGNSNSGGDSGGGYGGGYGGGGSGDDGSNVGEKEQMSIIIHTRSDIIEVPDKYDFNIKILNLKKLVTRVDYQMDRNGVCPANWVTVYSDSYSGSTSTTYTYSRTAWTPGIWYVKAVVYFQDGSIKESDIIKVEEQFPSIEQFSSNTTLRNHLSTTLWKKAVDFAQENKDTHAVKEYGCFIYLKRNGTYFAGATIEGPTVNLTSSGVWGYVDFKYNDTPYNPREEEENLLVGTMHTHYPLTWAVAGQYRDIGASTHDNNAALPGIGYDYASRVYSGHEVDASKAFFTYGRTRRKTTVLF